MKINWKKVPEAMAYISILIALLLLIGYTFRGIFI